MRVILFLLAFTLAGCAGPMITVRTIADCPSYRDQSAPPSVKAWLSGQYPDGKPATGVPDDLALWLKRVADNTQALNQACGIAGK